MDTMANQGHQIVLQGDVKERIEPLHIGPQLLHRTILIQEPIIILLRDQPRLDALVVQTSPEPRPGFRDRRPANRAGVAPLPALGTERGVAARHQHVLDIAAAAPEVPGRAAVLDLGFVGEVGEVDGGQLLESFVAEETAGGHGSPGRGRDVEGGGVAKESELAGSEA